MTVTFGQIKSLDRSSKPDGTYILKDSQIYQILNDLGLCHQKAHRDYENANLEAQKELVSPIRKLQDLQSQDKLILYDEFAVYDRLSLYYAWAEKNIKP